eukprot:5647229-Pyramimonas_sp.AAC.1
MTIGSQGVARHHVAVAVDRLGKAGWNDEAKILRDRLALFFHAESLHVSHIFDLSDQQLENALDKVAAHNILLPPDVHKSMLTRARNDLVKRKVDEYMAKQFIELVCPWAGAQNDNGETYDVKAPKASLCTT